MDEVGRRAAEDAVHGAQQGGPHLVHKAHDDAGGGQVVVDLLLRAPATATRAHRGWPGTALKTCRLGLYGEMCGEGENAHVKCTAVLGGEQRGEGGAHTQPRAPLMASPMGQDGLTWF